MPQLFAYGTLMFEAVFSAVCGGLCSSEEARLAGYARYPVRGHEFPGIVPKPGADTKGRLFVGIDDELWLRLDEFETDFYTRERVAVETRSGSIEAQTYVVAARHYKHLEHRPWSPQAFATHSLEQYLRKYA